MLRKIIEEIEVKPISISDLKVGDEFRTNDKSIYASGVITKISFKNVSYDSKYMTGEMLHLKIKKDDLYDAYIGRKIDGKSVVFKVA